VGEFFLDIPETVPLGVASAAAAAALGARRVKTSTVRDGGNSTVFDRFTEGSRRVVVLAQEEARAMNHHTMAPEHLFLALLRVGDQIATATLNDAGVQYETVQQAVRSMQPAAETHHSGQLPLSASTKKILELSMREALQLGHNHIGPEHILLGLLRDDSPNFVGLLNWLNLNPVTVRQEVVRRTTLSENLEPALAGAARGDKPAPTKALETFGRNLVAEAKDGKIDPVVGREGETLRMMQILGRRSKNNPVIVGEPGVGKSAIVEGLAQRIAEGRVPAALSKAAIWKIDLGAMVAGTRYRGDFEERLKRLVAEASADKNAILFLDEIHTVVGAGNAEGSMDAANLLKPALARGELRLIGATTRDEYRKHIESDAALERRFAPVVLEEPSVSETVAVLRGLRAKLEAHHQVKISDPALLAASRLSQRYLPDRRLPDKAIDLLDEAASRLRLAQDMPEIELESVRGRLTEARNRRQILALSGDWNGTAEAAAECESLEKQERVILELLGAKSRTEVGEQEVAGALSVWTGIPATQLSASETTRLLEMEQHLTRRVLGQEEAISAVARAVRRARSGVRDGRRPAGSFLMLGPTGVGKTELAKALAEFLFGDESALIRLDMSEYQERHSVSRLVGSPPGYVGYDEGGQLTEAVRRRPWSVVLFDEVEKAHPEVFNTLLQVLEDGRLTDSQGRVVDFTNTVVILTANLGSEELSRAGVGFTSAPSDEKRARTVSLEATKKHFRPEFLNRLDETVVFRSLSREDMSRIVTKFAAEMIERMAESGLQVEITASAQAHLAVVGWDPMMGARPLRRAFQRLVEDQLATLLLEERLGVGETIIVDTETGPEGTATIGVRRALPETDAMLIRDTER
jgi:ATP-dependent Clp protease ATP-binding subunit ClpC